MKRGTVIIISVLSVLTVIYFLFRDKINPLLKQIFDKTKEAVNELKNTIITSTGDKVTNDNIMELHPAIRQKVYDAVNELKTKHNIIYRIYSAKRTFAEQAVLYGKGRTKDELKAAGVDTKYAAPSEKKVTNAKPYSSYHEYALAFDGVEIRDGKAVWTNDKMPVIENTFKKYGFFWGGDFVSLKDTPHFEWRGYGSVNDLYANFITKGLDKSGFLIV